MVKINVFLNNDFDSKYEKVEITKEELMQIACNKAKGNYSEGHWTYIQAEDDIEVTIKAS